MDWSARALELMWVGGLAAVPVALLAGLLARCKGCRPATRHALWVAVLATLAAPMLSAGLWRPDWFRSERVLAAADALASHVAAPSNEAVLQAVVDPKPALESPRSPARFADAAPEVERAAGPFEVTPAQEPAASAGPPQAAAEPTQDSPTEPADLALLPVRLAQFIGTLPAAAAPSVAPAEPVEAMAENRTQDAAVSANEAPSLPSLRDWLGSVLRVRDAISAVPAIPPALWLAGAAAMALLGAVRWLSTARLLQRGRPAPPPIELLVRSLSRVAGLRRAPRTLVVDDRVSPMIWCGVRPRLILPLALWRELDAPSQSAVIMHELSHLRRRDHRMCWAESLIGLLYWWHPVAWWARRRLRDEAEACCDAWVVSLIPGGRRAYAEALVTTKSFLSMPGSSGAPGLGVVNGRTKQLARRLTMVMTQRVAPRSSFIGAAMALAIAATGMLVMLGLACPPTEKERAEQAAAKQAETAARQAEQTARQAEQAARQAERAAMNEARAAERAAREAQSGQPGAGSTEFFGEAPALEAMRGRDAQAGSQDADRLLQQLKERERTLQQMERQLQDLQRKLERMRAQPAQNSAQHSRSSRGDGPSIALAPAAPMMAAPGAAPRGVVIAGGGPASSVAIGGGSAPAGSVTIGGGASGLYAPAAPRSVYSQNLARPRIVTTPQAKADETRAYALPAGKLEALADLMSRQDVPILIERQDGQIVVHGTPDQQRTFAAFIRLINPDGGTPTSVYTVPQPTVAQGTQPASRAQTEQLRSALAAAARAQKDSARQAEQIRKQAEKLREAVERARDKAAEREDGDENDGESSDAGKAARQQVLELDRLLARAEAAEAQLDSLDGVAEGLESRLDSLMEAVDAMDEKPEVAEIPEPALPAFPPEAPQAAPTASMPPLPSAAPTAPFGAPATPTPPVAPSAPEPGNPDPAQPPAPTPAPGGMSS
jgi:beta-lactamase regulating signal transducer with metallopeptidase domain